MKKPRLRRLVKCQIKKIGRRPGFVQLSCMFFSVVSMALVLLDYISGDPAMVAILGTLVTCTWFWHARASV